MSDPNYDSATYTGPWPDLVKPLLRFCEQMEPRPKILQIKEKFGTLRFYVTKPKEKSEDAGEFWDFQYAGLLTEVQRAERNSARYCEVCCQPGMLRTETGWLRTLCDTHNAEHMEQQKHRLK